MSGPSPTDDCPGAFAAVGGWCCCRWLCFNKHGPDAESAVSSRRARIGDCGAWEFGRLLGWTMGEVGDDCVGMLSLRLALDVSRFQAFHEQGGLFQIPGRLIEGTLMCWL